MGTLVWGARWPSNLGCSKLGQKYSRENEFLHEIRCSYAKYGLSICRGRLPNNWVEIWFGPRIVNSSYRIVQFLKRCQKFSLIGCQDLHRRQPLRSVRLNPAIKHRFEDHLLEPRRNILKCVFCRIFTSRQIPRNDWKFHQDCSINGWGHDCLRCQSIRKGKWRSTNGLSHIILRWLDFWMQQPHFIRWEQRQLPRKIWSEKGCFILYEPR